VVPKNTKLTERNAGIKAWNTLSADEKKLYARFMETYAGFLEYTDYEIGRVISHIKESGELDNTLVIVSVGDNGASKEGTFVGTVNNFGAELPEAQRLKKNLEQIDLIGTEFSKVNYPLGWAAATNVPFRQWKQDANAEGGTHNPLIVFYPKGIQEKGGIRSQYGHVIDILPTTLELTNIKAPVAVNGIKQDPIEGTSLVYSKLQFVYAVGDGTKYTVSSENATLPIGKAELKASVKYDQNGAGVIILYANNTKVGETAIGKTSDALYLHEGVNVGFDDLTPVGDTYKVPFAYTGKINKVTIDLDPGQQAQLRTGK
jgi:arylsulfatase A-like enzyme